MRLAAWAALLAILAGVLDFVPLFDLLHYDFCFALGLGAMLAGVDLGHGVVAAARRQGAALDPVRLSAAAVGRGLLVLVLPLLLSLANALRVRNCNLGAGLAFYALLPIGTMLFAAPSGVLAGLAAPRRGRLYAWLLPIASIAWTLLRLYRDPAVFAFDPFGGYFPGPIYDEAMRPPPRLVWFRLANLVWIGAAIAAAHAWRRRTRTAAAVAAVLLVASGVAYAARGRSGFHVSAGDLRRVLGGERRSPHFVLRYDHRSGRTPAELDLDIADLEFRYQQLRRTLGVEPAGPITAWQFPNTTVKKDVVGAANTLYAKPWSREIFILAERFPSGPLRHELAHIFAGAFGDPFFGVSLAWRLPLPRLASGLIEGVAEAADFGDPEGATTLHQDSRAIVADGRAPPLERLVGAGFSAVAGARAYTLAGSFCRWLLDTRGVAKLRDAYRSGGDFQAVYGAPLAALEQEWRRFLETQPLPPRARAAARERFRRPAIFQKVCARELASRVSEARGLLRSDPAQSVRLMEATCRDDPGEPVHRIDLAEALAAAGQPERALAVLRDLELAPDATEPLRARAAVLASAVSFQRRDDRAAAAAMERVLALAPDEGERRNARVKLRALADPEARATLGRALYGDGPGRPADPVLVFALLTDFARAHPGDPLGPYLVGRQLLHRDPGRALALLALACGAEAVGPALGDELLRECRRMTGEAAFRVGDMTRSRAAWEQIRDHAASEGERLRAIDWLERIAGASSSTTTAR